MTEPIAVIGIGCRLPGSVTTPSELWSLLKDPRDILTRIPASRFHSQGFYHSNGQHHGHSNVTHSYFLSTDDSSHCCFDAKFFNVRPAEAVVMDPQIRLLLEVVYEALDSGGLPLEDLRGSDTAVYVGLMMGDYERLMLRDEDTIGQYHVTRTTRSLASNRISYFFDWHGPSITVDMACSSSLVAVHHAIQQLRSGQSRVAIAAGANLILDPHQY
ncbi:uncharacterized protein JN550_002792 [Neoarthrinium moseri]|uniref:uncharacterized protein n=1 Tax=Neoarthrinium moseri TaxID=1658444 RepID=UPI001FDADFD6|nr:uncharacterized protein JN550_002792 [Neoarthrinium moseri]KAI1874213.1 hypothetical protein JN550_002792 [Neoarthrinium moseri]